jgi:hypothetical protein
MAITGDNFSNVYGTMLFRWTPSEGWVYVGKNTIHFCPAGYNAYALWAVVGSAQSAANHTASDDSWITTARFVGSARIGALRAKK